jgi:hypothetical protein
LVGGKEFENTSAGWREAADHVEAIGFASDAPFFRREAWGKAPLWSKIAHWFFDQCLRCKPHSTDDGIGGRCIDCGKIHGWVTRDELRALGEELIKAANEPV